MAGISGVGKTTLCQHLVADCPGMHHLVASTFVEGGRAVDQMALVGRIRGTAEGLEGVSLVDGRLIVGENRVPQEAVAALAPRGILVVTGSPADIVARRAADSRRCASAGYRRVPSATSRRPKLGTRGS